MSRVDDFCTYLLTEVDNHSLYCLGAQGESVMTSTFKFLNDRESKTRVRQILEKMATDYGNNVDYARAKWFDCSGLGIYYFLKMGYVKSDMTADGIYRICTPISKSDLRKGDCVFQEGTKDGKKYMHHIGYCVGKDSNGNFRIVEAKGRSYGVVNSVYSSSNWSHCGRLKFLNFSINRVLKYEAGTPLMKGEDVVEVQKVLKAKGYNPGTIDGEYGKNTANAVAAFQEKETTVLKSNYGKVNKNTAIALGFDWK